MAVEGPGVVFESVGVGSNFDLIVGYLRGMIVRGDLEAGQRLPPEPDLAKQLGVSRPVLREALKALEVSGYLGVRRGYGGGRFVTAPEPEEFHTITAAPLSTLHVESRHVMDVRLAIEPMAARLAAEARDAADLVRGVRRLRLAGTRPARIVDAVVQFHLALMESSGNPVFVAVYQSLRGPIALGLGRRVRDESWRAAVGERLTHLVRLVDDGEPDAAERAARRYLREYEDDREQQEVAQ